MPVNRNELVAIVDENNVVTGAVPRWRLRAENLLHRATYVYVFDSAELIYAQHRTMAKDTFPGYWDLAAGGVVAAGEEYDESARRELGEELGITGVALDTWFDFYWEGSSGRVFGRAYGCVYDGALLLEAEEVQDVERLRVEEVLADRAAREFTPDTLYALQKRFATLSQ